MIPSLPEYEEYIYSLPERYPFIQVSTLVVKRTSATSAQVIGTIFHFFFSVLSVLFCGECFLVDLSPIEEPDDPFGLLRQTLLVGDHHHRGLLLPVQLQEDVHDLTPHLAVEIPCRLIR